MDLFVPDSDEALAARVVGAAEARAPLAICGAATRGEIGQAVAAQTRISTRALTGITLYEPAEMVIRARAGTPVREVEAALAAKGQMLPFEPPDPRVLSGSDGEPTMGGLAATNASGPRRLSAGAARDSLIGMTFVNGRGEIIHSGGRVMKNVTGLDLARTLAGSRGTLGIMTDVTFKVLPKPPGEATLVFSGLTDAAAVALMTRSVTTPFEVNAAAHLPANGSDKARTCLRIAGFDFSLAYRFSALKDALAEFGAPERLDGAAHDDLWSAIRDVRPFAAENGTEALWRLSIAPVRGAALMERLASLPAARWFYDWSGGLIWLSVAADGDGSAAAIRAAAKALGGHATLMRAPSALRDRISVFEPQNPALAALSARLKASLDPHSILNPGLGL